MNEIVRLAIAAGRGGVSHPPAAAGCRFDRRVLLLLAGARSRLTDSEATI